MAALLLLVVSIVTITLQTVPVASQIDSSNLPCTYEAKVIDGGNGACPTAEEREAVRNEIRQEVQMLLRANSSQAPTDDYSCGGTDGWIRIAYLDASDSSQQCPPGLTESTYSGIRLCGRAPDASQDNCTSTTFQGATQYNAVCGRVIGYHYGYTGAFGYYTLDDADNTIDEYYVDGVTLTHGPVGAREHIWTFATGSTETGSVVYGCACATIAGSSSPSFIGDNYFCESGAHNNALTFYNEPLWDGNDCPTGNSCCTFNNPPYFTRQLPASTSDDIELRVCGHNTLSRGNGDTFVQAIELYAK